MRLTQLLFVNFPKNRGIPGLTYGGKKQRYKPVKTCAKDKAVNMMMMTEQNLMYLNKPYLSAQEEMVYGLNHPEKKLKRREDFVANKKKLQRFWPDSRIEDHFASLNRNKKWE